MDGLLHASILICPQPTEASASHFIRKHAPPDAHSARESSCDPRGKAIKALNDDVEIDFVEIWEHVNHEIFLHTRNLDFPPWYMSHFDNYLCFLPSLAITVVSFAIK